MYETFSSGEIHLARHLESPVSQRTNYASEAQKSKDYV